ncbi:MAG: amidase [Rhodospirillales bacterium]|nr:amidase [Rhodospirillales bacterium]
MTNSDPLDLSLAEVAEAIKRRELSSLEVTTAALRSLEQRGRELNAVAGLDPEQALSAARSADADLAAGTIRGPLHGVPLAHKDMYYRAGRVSACGSRIRADFVPDETSTALERLDAAGALDIARLNMVEFAVGPSGHNQVTGTPSNPWNSDHLTGGSSSGPGAAVADRMVFGALGSDTGGSIRLPASACGLCGIKATYGRVSRFGAMPLSFTLDHIGPLTRTVDDCAIILQIIAGHDPRDPTSSREPVPDFRAGLEDGVKGCRIAVPTNYFYDPLHGDVAGIMEESIRVYEKLGAQIVPVELPGIERANPLVTLIIAAEGAAYHDRWMRERPRDYGSQTLGRLRAGLFYPAVRYVEALSFRREYLAQFNEAVFSKADVLHAPVWPYPVPTIEESDLEANPGFSEFVMNLTHCTRPINYLGLPAFSVPGGFTANGLPCGFQLVGKAFDEANLFRIGRAYERETEWTEMAPRRGRPG